MSFRIIGFCLLGILVSQSKLLAQDSLRTRVAEKGDGIYSMLRKQGIDPVQYYGDFIELNQGNLSEGSRLYEGRQYLIPEAPDSALEMGTIINLINGEEYSIFGRAYVTPKSKRLQSTVYYLISNLHGPDFDAVQRVQEKNITEEGYAYDVTLRLAKELLSHGAKVYVILQDYNNRIGNDNALEINSDVDGSSEGKMSLDQLEQLEQRVDIVNKLYLKHSGKYQRLIVTHVDSHRKAQNNDMLFYYHEKSSNGQRLAESIRNTFQRKNNRYRPSSFFSGTFSDRSNLYLVRNSLPAMVYIEIGNITNRKDPWGSLNRYNRQAFANSIANGVLSDFEE